MMMLILGYVESGAPLIKFKWLLKLKNLHFFCKHDFLLRCVLAHNFDWYNPCIIIYKTRLLKFILILPYLSD